MQYRDFTGDNLKTSILGFGCMRFPVLNNDLSQIDEEKASEMLQYALDNGVNYFDTAYPYHQGKSEIIVGNFFKNRSRESIYLATKNPVWLVEKYEDFEKYLDEQLEKLQTDYIDFYLLHSLHEKSWNKIKNLKVFHFIEEMKKKGKFKYIGFSFHDELPLFKEIVDSYPWDFCQIQLNYLDRKYQAGLEGLRYAKEKGIDVVIMEPIKGGKLANPSDEINDIWNESEWKRTPSEWALKWLFDKEEVSLVLSGMSTLEHVKENVEVARTGTPNSLTEKELNLIERVTSIYEEKIKVGCTSCEYCLPCPYNVSIPNIFEMYNNIFVFGTEEASKTSYKKFIENSKDASLCAECGACESICPQHLEIIKSLKDADLALR